MQPNQQQKNKPTSSPEGQPGLPYGAPDYLGLETTPQKPKKSKILIRLTLFLAPVVLLLVAGTLVYWYWQHNSTQEKFYKAVGAQMTAGYVAKKMTITPKNPEDKSVLMVDSRSDFSDVKRPKTYLTYVIINNMQKVAEGNIISVGDASRYALLSMESILSKELGLLTKTWYKAPEKGRVFNRIFDTNQLADQLNAPMGLPIIGSFDVQQRVATLGALKESKAFVVKELKNETDNMQVFVIGINPDVAYKFYTELAVMQKIARVSKDKYLSVANVTGDLKLGFNPKENRFTKVMYTTKFVQSKSAADVVIDLSYPSTPKIDLPESSQNLKLPTETGR